MRAGEVPLEVGARLSCQWRDGDYYPVRVIERRKRDPEHGGGPLRGDPTDFEYYVHYEQCAPRRRGMTRTRAVLRMRRRGAAGLRPGVTDAHAAAPAASALAPGARS
jgi:hypothetical protein